jgi:hypothetical protein
MLKGLFHQQGQGLTRSQLLAMRCRMAGRGLLLFYLISVAGSVVPFQFAAAAWYLTLCRALVNNAPILVLGMLSISLWAHYNPEQSVNRRGSFVWPLAGLSRFSTILFFAVVVLQLLAASALYQQTAGNSRQQLLRLDQELDRLGNKLNAATSVDQLQKALQPFSNGAALRSQAPDLGTNQPLSATKKTLEERLKSFSLTAQRRANQQKRELATNLVANSVRVCISAIVIAFISLSFARWVG